LSALQLFGMVVNRASEWIRVFFFFFFLIFCLWNQGNMLFEQWKNEGRKFLKNRYADSPLYFQGYCNLMIPAVFIVFADICLIRFWRANDVSENQG
jgi:hypothetical protein